MTFPEIDSFPFIIHNSFSTVSPAPFCANIFNIVVFPSNVTVFSAFKIVYSLSPIFTFVVFDVDSAFTFACLSSLST